MQYFLWKGISILAYSAQQIYSYFSPCFGISFIPLRLIWKFMDAMYESGPPPKLPNIMEPGPNELTDGSSNTEPSSASLAHSIDRPESFQGDGETVGTKGLIKKHEFVKIITGALYTLGYGRIGASLENASGISLESAELSLLKQQVMEGKWNDSLKTLHTVGLVDENMVKSASLLILEQQFLELLKENKTEDAVRLLKDDIEPLSDPDRIDALRVTPPGNCNEDDISILKMRRRFVEKLLESLPVTVAIPERRLEHLVEMALDVQRDACLYHNMMLDTDDMSLYLDHKCERDQIPYTTKQVLKEHKGEVWFLQFSHNGKYLASSSSDKSAIIWEVKGGQISSKHRLNQHDSPVLRTSWSPDDNQLLTCGMNETVRRWDVESGQCLHVYQKPGIGMISCGWLPDGKYIVCGMTNGSICLWEVGGAECQSWACKELTANVSEMVTIGDQFICICTDSNILLLNRHTNVWSTAIDEVPVITSFSVSEDNKFLLVNLMNEEIHLWDIEKDPRMVATFKGYKRCRFIIRSCLGGVQQAFVASGSEDSQVYIWHRTTGTLLGTLPGHTRTVNCVGWNPKNPHMLASGSDDRTIRIWGLE
ncbi:hypothetical protein ACH5RR_003922 [Cinchona calisaya]|uniref:CTLH domain-containing protein n=1 Tax=Cinchona calisaya TaxID=153742 RepID=A0ABD3AWI0_9GENT